MREGGREGTGGGEREGGREGGREGEGREGGKEEWMVSDGLSAKNSLELRMNISL